MQRISRLAAALGLLVVLVALNAPAASAAIVQGENVDRAELIALLAKNGLITTETANAIQTGALVGLAAHEQVMAELTAQLQVAMVDKAMEERVVNFYIESGLPLTMPPTEASPPDSPTTTECAQCDARFSACMGVCYIACLPFAENPFFFFLCIAACAADCDSFRNDCRYANRCVDWVVMIPDDHMFPG